MRIWIFLSKFASIGRGRVERLIVTNKLVVLDKDARFRNAFRSVLVKVL